MSFQLSRLRTWRANSRTALEAFGFEPGAWAWQEAWPTPQPVSTALEFAEGTFLVTDQGPVSPGDQALKRPFSKPSICGLVCVRPLCAAWDTRNNTVSFSSRVRSRKIACDLSMVPFALPFA